MNEFIAKVSRVEAQLISEMPHLQKAILEIGQDLRSHVVGLSAPDRPIAVVLLPGTTAQNPLFYALARYLYDEAPILFEMRQYADAESATLLKQKLINVAFSPIHKVLLFSDMEKAHAAVRAVFTGIFHGVHLTDEQGKTAALTDSLFFMTTTVAADLLTSPAAFENPVVRRRVSDAINQVFEHTFLTPLDEIIPIFKGDIEAC